MTRPKEIKQTLTLVRGLPGSGKSTLAKNLCQATGAVHLEAD
ncbi:MAG TPA: AAA family ATPase, partial [Thalassospira sp.]|nr:AAA family ATPase [Thalassospira sp.]